MTRAAWIHGEHAAVLVVSGSSVLRELLRRVLLLHGYEVCVAGTCREALEELERQAPLALILSDAALPDGSGLELLRAAHERSAPPDAILVTGHPDEDEARRARELGAIGYLVKPVAFRDIARALHARAGTLARRPPRRRHRGRACPIDAEESQGGLTPQVLWQLRDVSTTGAFLDTEAPVPVGTKLTLALELGPTRIRVAAEVVRVQEPAWGRSGGIGVTFVEMSTHGRDLLAAFVAADAGESG